MEWHPTYLLIEFKMYVLYSASNKVEKMEEGSKILKAGKANK